MDSGFLLGRQKVVLYVPHLFAASLIRICKKADLWYSQDAIKTVVIHKFHSQNGIRPYCYKHIQV